MILKDTPIYSILKSKCPRCHEGNFYETTNPYNLKKFDKMHAHCSVCGQSFTKEPGFYYGATYASYALTVGFGIITFLISHFLFKVDDIYFLYFFPFAIVVIAPIVFRSSRLIWINIFVKYQPPAR